MDDHDALRVAALVVWETDRLARKQQRRDQKRAEREWQQEEIQRNQEESYRRQVEYLQSDEYARWRERYDQNIKEKEQKRQLRRQERARQSKEIINNPSLHAHDEYLINRLLAIGCLTQPTYYATNTFAFFFIAERHEQFSNLPVVWTYLDDNDYLRIEVRQYFHPQMEVINQAVAGWHRRQTEYEPSTNAAWLMSYLGGLYGRVVNDKAQSAQDVSLINRLIAIGLPQPTYYGINTFAFWHGNQPIVWTYLDKDTYRMTWRDYGHPQIEEIKQAVADWRMIPQTRSNSLFRLAQGLLARGKKCPATAPEMGH